MAERSILYDKLKLNTETGNHNTKNLSYDAKDNIDDKSWVITRMLTPNGDLNPTVARNRFYNNAMKKIVDTSIGGHIALNPRPQFCRYADPREKGRLESRGEVSPSNDTPGLGMGEFYSRAFDDNAQLLFLQMGLPEFTSFISWLKRAVSRAEVIVAHKGYLPMSYKIGRVIGSLGAIAFFGFGRFLVFSALQFGIKFFVGNETNKYYKLRPEMAQFWGKANVILNQIAIEKGFTPYSMEKNPNKKIGAALRPDKDLLGYMKEAMPDIISDEGRVDIYAIATRSQILANEVMKSEYEKYGNIDGNIDDVLGYTNIKYKKEKGPSFQDWFEKLILGVDNNASKKKETAKPLGVDATSGLGGSLGGIGSAIEGITSTVASVTGAISDVKAGFDAVQDSTKSTDSKDPNEDPTNIPDSEGKYLAKADEITSTYIERLKKYFRSTVHGGGGYLALQVDLIKESSITFSNEVGNIPLEYKLNQIGGAALDARFSLSDGNIFGNMVKSVTDTIGETLSGGLESMTFGLSNIVYALFGGGYTEMGKMWKNSSVTFPQYTFRIDLTMPFNEPLATLLYQDSVIATILAATLPTATGKATFTSPMLSSAFLKGHLNGTKGMITSFTIKRGDSNIGWNSDRQALSTVLEFTYTDFTEHLAAPVVMNAFDIAINDEDSLSNFISTLAGRSLHENRFIYPKLIMKYYKAKYGVQAMFSPAYHSMALFNTVAVPFQAVLDSNNVAYTNNSHKNY